MEEWVSAQWGPQQASGIGRRRNRREGREVHGDILQGTGEPAMPGGTDWRQQSRTVLPQVSSAWDLAECREL